MISDIELAKQRTPDWFKQLQKQTCNKTPISRLLAQERLERKEALKKLHEDLAKIRSKK
jgi:hypothetical protein|tara:strand:- start:7024 stop:7200 length:177 start_codon:yes stop_codon:yes gene_type:complete